MEFQKLTYIDNGVPSLSIGGFTNGVRVVDMAKGYSTLANGGVYNDQTCIRRIDHPDAMASYALIWNKNHQLSRTAEIFIEHVKHQSLKPSHTGLPG